jgi:hypothetical protein
LYSVTPGGHYVREYAAILQQIVNGDWFTHETFSDLYSIVFEHYSKDATPGKKFHNTNGLKSSFSLERTSSFSSNDNISMLEYLNAKLKTLNKYMQRLDEYASAQSPAANTGWYVRADYTDWAVNEQHTLTAEGNLLVYTVSKNREFRLKVYSKVLDNWYGSECVSKDSPVSCRTDDHTNIILDAGSYKITYDPVTETITIEEQ